MREPNSQPVVSSVINVYKSGPLPIINAACEESGLVDVLDQQLSWDETQYLISPGDAIKALIMNCLTEGQPMYRLPEFFQETDTENLFGEDIGSDHLNHKRSTRSPPTSSGTRRRSPNAKRKNSCFVVVTTLTDGEEWPAERVLDKYKNQ